MAKRLSQTRSGDHLHVENYTENEVASKGSALID